jgi:hypothetical protein
MAGGRGRILMNLHHPAAAFSFDEAVENCGGRTCPILAMPRRMRAGAGRFAKNGVVMNVFCG